MMSRVLLVLWLSIMAAAQAPYKAHGKALLPNPKVTPGATNPGCTKALICSPEFRASKVRATIKNFPKLKREACAEYGVKKCDGTVEADHLVPIEVCGNPSSLGNIWPQPFANPGAHLKDRAENKLHRLVCSGQMSLAEAQTCIAKDWVACYQKVMAMDVKKGKAVH